MKVTQRFVWAALAVCVFLSPPTPVRAQEKELTNADLKEILEQLKELGELAKERKTGKHQTALAAYQEAAASNAAAYEFYLKCMKLIEFDQKEKRSSEYRDWKKDSKDEVRSSERLTAMRLQLQWLVLAIKAENSKDIGPLIPSVYAFLDNIVAEQDELGRKSLEILRRPATRSIFAVAYGLDTALDQKRWEFTPMNINGIFEKVILPFHRALEDKSAVMAAWDKRIHLLAQIEADKELRQSEIDFKGEILPRLQWGKYRDLFQLGDRSTAIRQMLAIIQKHIGHDDAEKWVREISGLIEDRLLGIDSFAEESEGDEDMPAG